MLAYDYPEEFKFWVKESNTVVLLSVPDEDTLLDWADFFIGFCASSNKLEAPWTLFYEPDIDEHTSLAAILDPKQATRLSHLPLLGLEGGEDSVR